MKHALSRSLKKWIFLAILGLAAYLAGARVGLKEAENKKARSERAFGL